MSTIMDVSSSHHPFPSSRPTLDKSSRLTSRSPLLLFSVRRGVSVRRSFNHSSISDNFWGKMAALLLKKQLCKHEPWQHSFQSSNQRSGIARSETMDAGTMNTSPHSFSDSELLAKFRAVLFYTVTAISAIFLIVPMLIQHPFVLLLDGYRRKSQYFIAKIWATLTLLFFELKVEGLQNLPPPDASAVYVSNHQSFLDIYTLLSLGRSFKFISKRSIFKYPVIGWAMSMLGVIPLNRTDTRSQAECLKKCIELVKNGSSVFFFPEGTRSKDGNLGAFKKGAFSIAVKTSVPVVPIVVMGTGRLMPSGKENTLNCGSIRVVVLEPIKGLDAQDLCVETRNRIAQVLT